MLDLADKDFKAIIINIFKKINKLAHKNFKGNYDNDE